MVESLDDVLDAFEAAGFAKEAKPVETLSQEQQRILFGFEEIVTWAQEHGRVPVQRAEADIFEKMYAVRLAQVLAHPEWHDLLTDADGPGLLSGAVPEVLDGAVEAAAPPPGSLEDIFASLEGAATADPLFDLKHVRPKAEIDAAAAQDAAQREPCPDFEPRFSGLFDLLRDELRIGRRRVLDFANEQEIARGQFFVLKGVTAYVAEHSLIEADSGGRRNARLRVVFENGTQSRMLARSLSAELYKKENAGRRITDPEGGPLLDHDDSKTGWLYVLRSLSDDPWVREHQMVLHKIGQTSGSVERRIAGAATEPTYLHAPVEVVARFELERVNRRKLETALHVFFHEARLDVELIDRWGKPFRPREWFLLSYGVIEQAVELAIAQRLAGYRYAVQAAAIVEK